MIQGSTLYEGMRRWFRRLPAHYIITSDEQIELLWSPRGKNQTLHRECFPDLEQASQRAISLGPACDVFLQVVVEPGTTPWNTESTDLLAGWYESPCELGSNCLTAHALPYAEPSHVWSECFFDGATTCEAVRYYYRSRCAERARAEEEKRRRHQDEGGSN